MPSEQALEIINVLGAIQFPIQFPVSYKALVVTSDQNCADNLEAVLNQCGFQVTRTSVGAEAIALGREDRKKFDFIFYDEHVDGMDDYCLSTLLALMTITYRTVYTYSADRWPLDFNIPSFILCKPVKTEKVKELIEIERQKKGRWVRHKVRRMIEEFPADGVWAPEVHYKFVAAVHVLGEQACPKSIMEFMNVEELSEKDVENQLERYRAHVQSRAISSNNDFKV